MLDTVLSSGQPVWLAPIAIWVIIVLVLLLRAGLNETLRKPLLFKLGLMLALVYPTLFGAELLRSWQWELLRATPGFEPQVFSYATPDGTILSTYVWSYDVLLLDHIPYMFTPYVAGALVLAVCALVLLSYGNRNDERMWFGPFFAALTVMFAAFWYHFHFHQYGLSYVDRAMQSTVFITTSLLLAVAVGFHMSGRTDAEEGVEAEDVNQEVPPAPILSQSGPVFTTPIPPSTTGD